MKTDRQTQVAVVAARMNKVLFDEERILRKSNMMMNKLMMIE